MIPSKGHYAMRLKHAHTGYYARFVLLMGVVKYLTIIFMFLKLIIIIIYLLQA